MKITRIVIGIILLCCMSGMAAFASNTIKIDLNKRSILVSGVLNNPINQKATIIILKASHTINDLTDDNIDENVEAVDQVDVATDGSFSFEYSIKEALQGTYYNIVIGSQIINEAPIYIDSVSNLNQALSEIKMANKDTIVPLIMKYKDTFLFTNIDDFNTVADFGQIFLNINKRQSPNEIRTTYFQALAIAMTNKLASNLETFSDYLNIDKNDDFNKSKTELYRILSLKMQKSTDLVTFHTSYNEALATAMVNVSDRVEMTSVLEKYNAILNLNLNGAYKSNIVDVNKVLVGKNFNTIQEIQIAFQDKITAISNSSTNTNTPKTTKGSGGGGQIIKDNAPEDKPAIKAAIFSDLANVQWANESIVYLYNKGAVTGYGDGEFRPSQNIKREEYVKMLIKAFDFDILDENSEFSDLPKDNWSYPYVSTAKKIGLVGGRSDSTFGTGELISREDAVVMLYRVLSAKKIAAATAVENISFADNSQIEAYAWEAVNSLYNMGIVDGTGNNLFSPKAFLTRAECSKLIYGLLQKV